MGRRRRDWDARELAILRQEFPAGGVAAVDAAYDRAGLVRRKRDRILAAAKREGLEHKPPSPAAPAAAASRAKPGPKPPVSAGVAIMETQDAGGLLADLHGLCLRIGLAAGELREGTRQLGRLMQEMDRRLGADRREYPASDDPELGPLAAAIAAVAENMGRGERRGEAEGTGGGGMLPPVPANLPRSIYESGE